MMFHAVSREAADEFEAAWLSACPESGSRRRAGYLAWEAMRIAAWKPRLGRETDARGIPPEVDWLLLNRLASFSFDLTSRNTGLSA